MLTGDGMLSSPFAALWKHRKATVALLATILVCTALGVPGTRTNVKLQAAISSAVQLLHDADRERREIHPLPLLG